MNQTPPAETPNADAVSGLPELPEWVPAQISEGWAYLGEHPFLGALILLMAGFIAAKIAQFVITRGVARMARKTETEFDDKVIELLHRPVFLTVFLGALGLATASLRLPAAPTGVTLKALATVVILVWLSAGLPIMRLVLDALGRHHDRFPMVEERTIPLFDILSKLVLIGGGAYAFLLVWGIDATAWLASAGVIGIAVGFAAKDTLANLFSGFFIVADAPYKLGDFIVLDSGERGRVTHVGIRSTRILTRDDIEITLPNAQIANSKIINESGGPWEKERIRIKVGVAYGSDVDQVVEVLENVAQNHDHICETPSPRVRMRGFGASSLDFELLCWIDEPVLRGKLSHGLYMDVYKTFASEGIEIPYDKHDVYVKEMPGPDNTPRVFPSRR